VQVESEPGRQPTTAPAAKYEDWLLVMRMETTSSTSGEFGASPAHSASATPIAGWVLAQFILLDPPTPIPDYANATAMRVVAWAVLNSVPDPTGDKPQFVVAGARSAKPIECDFSALRVLTWGAGRQRYETAYIENNLCGRMPIVVQSTPGGAEFRFAAGGLASGERVYRMRQTVVRRVRDAPAN
jgi:hypothetical protein